MTGFGAVVSEGAVDAVPADQDYVAFLEHCVLPEEFGALEELEQLGLGLGLGFWGLAYSDCCGVHLAFLEGNENCVDAVRTEAEMIGPYI